ncbi:hypothetical protein J2W32_005930 [Variovorax boronicumulans]|uniref:Uncharacterized protein n=1 Tax=Variovorax boronicumulans TaxID=436515 RepID=A0AAW8D6J5_9BURK|nr:hypothetical protein [Variovorax boronicumulans]MDP9993907.1 hypothetical protein [Variovorax boronicumulans]MDQ0005230.1 hypothetical protein [Variovorax boronicumulans]MDQ0036631.1 hypothetical protein [Variovorax boronicumulans]MDQ0056856.1 hypothetical protein [Variovorax boronicumulans]
MSIAALSTLVVLMVMVVMERLAGISKRIR